MQNKKYIWGAVVILGIILLFVLYGLGYRFGGSHIIGKTGKIVMTIPYTETSIYIDQSDKRVTSKENELVEIELSPTTHSIIVSHAGYLPWTKNVLIPSSGIKNISPIFVAQNSAGYIVGAKDPEYFTIKNKITHDIPPSKNSPKVSSDKTISIWLEDNAIIAKKGDVVTTVIQPDSTIRNLDFYKDRSDAVVFSINGNIYVIEIEKEGTQNFIPLYTGKFPSFIKADANNLYVLDGISLLQLAM